MRCEYCDVEVVQYPANGICVCCGAKLPPRPAAVFSQPVQVPVYIPVQPQPQLISGVNCCPKCHSTQIIRQKRGFSWGLGILGFFLIPGFGLLLGFCGSKKLRTKCCSCNHKWKRP